MSCTLCRTNYDEEFIRLLYKVVNEDNHGLVDDHSLDKNPLPSQLSNRTCE